MQYDFQKQTSFCEHACHSHYRKSESLLLLDEKQYQYSFLVTLAYYD